MYWDRGMSYPQCLIVFIKLCDILIVSFSNLKYFLLATLVMGRYQKSQPSKKVRAKLEQKKLERRERQRQRRLRSQEETLETLALGVEELVGQLEDKEKEMVEVIDHEIELSEEVMDLDNKFEELQGRVEQDKNLNKYRNEALRMQDRLGLTALQRENTGLRERIRVLQSASNTRDDMIRSQGRQLEELRSLNRAQVATIRMLRGGRRGN